MAEPAPIESHAPAVEERPRIVYVMGAGRSGSTIFGVTLGNCEDVFYAGELDAWLTRSGEPLISGGERTRFWSAVRDDVDGAEPLFGRTAERSLERSISLFRVNRWSTRRRLRAPYRHVAESLYRAITAHTGSRLIVDTSHYPLRARELQSLKGIDLYLVYLARDPQSVAASFNNKDVAQYNKSTLTTNVYLWLTNLLAIPVFLRHPRDRRLFVRYEDFIADPQAVVSGIVELAGLDSAPPDFTSLSTGIPFQGNRLIRKDVIELSARPAGPAKRSLLTSVMQFPMTLALSRLRPTTSAGTR